MCDFRKGKKQDLAMLYFAAVLVCLPALALQVGDRVKHTAGTVNVRNSASTSCSLLSTAARNGDLGVIVDGSESANGLT